MAITGIKGAACKRGGKLTAQVSLREQAGGESLSDGTRGDAHCAHMALRGKKLIRCWTETPEHVYAETSLATPFAGSGSKVIVSLWLI